MSMYTQFKTDVQLEQKGIIIDYGDFRVTVARAGGGNKKFARALEAKTKPLRRAIQTETLSNERGDEVLQEVYAEAVVLLWETKVDGKWQKGIENPVEGGKLLPFSAANVLATFKALPEIFADLREQAARMVLFRQDLMDNDQGN